jgi:hypothetical protein
MPLVCYSLAIYLLNLFLAFLQPKFDPAFSEDDALEDGDMKSPLPTKADEEFRPFIRRLPEFKFWVSATRAITIAFFCSWFQVFDVPVFWPVLVVYWIILFTLTSMYLLEYSFHILKNYSEATDCTYDQISLCSFYIWQDTLRSTRWSLGYLIRIMRIFLHGTTAPS